MEGPEEGPAKTGAPITCWRFRRSGDGSYGWDGRRGLVAPVVLGVRASTCGGPPVIGLEVLNEPSPIEDLSL